MAVANGQLDASLLATIPGTSLRLRRGPAAAWSAVVAQVQRRFGWTPSLTDAYRDLSTQIALFRARYVQQNTGNGPFGDVRWWMGARYVRTSAAGSAAVPGSSNHGWGVAVDVTGMGGVGDFSQVRRTQFATVAAPLGWSDAEGRAVGEPWHWSYPGPADTVANVVAVALAQLPTNPAGTLPAPLEEIDMRYVFHAATGQRFLFTGTALVPLTDPQANTCKALYGDPKALEAADITLLDQIATAAAKRAAATTLPAGSATTEQIAAAVKAGLVGLTLKAQA